MTRATPRTGAGQRVGRASRRVLAPVAVGLLVPSTMLLSGCTTTQDRSAVMSKQAKKAAAAKQFKVGRTNREVRVRKVVRLAGDGSAAVVVRIDNTTGAAQTAVPIGLDLYDAQDRSLYTNRIDGLDPALNTVPVAPPGVSYWVNNQVPVAKPDRMRVRVGVPRAKAPTSLPKVQIAKLKLGEDAGVATATGVVRNRSSVEQRKLTLFAVALEGDRIVAAGRAVIDRLAAAGGRAQRFSVYFTGDPRGAELRVFAPPSTIPGA